MRNRVLALAACLLTWFPIWASDQPAIAASVQVWFSPKGGCTEAIVHELDAAKRIIRVQAYSFTSVPIAKALREAKERGVDVRIVLDKSQRTERYTSADFMANAGIPVLIDDRHAIAHSKVMIIDDGTVVTGSFNFTKAAEESNLENLLVIRSAELAAVYSANWVEHAGHSEAYTSKAERAAGK